ncbi:hypothetical protein HMPREF3293_01892 [Christensenella minuta]|uniref:Uncharacterized protein n=1 Tax=Christensenella minuta TaxID=626937 RepID=A0A136Q3T4_9FIRM|nr:hypothetical protein HMPREF3293_01892 [Christensenella minuta]
MDCAHGRRQGHGSLTAPGVKLHIFPPQAVALCVLLSIVLLFRGLYNIDI